MARYYAVDTQIIAVYLLLHRATAFQVDHDNDKNVLLTSQLRNSDTLRTTIL